MASLSNSPSKFLAVIEKLQEMIKTESLQPGDKLPSERELSETLLIGRSSVREALRALELIGLIETRRGEGTFLRDFSDHQLVPLIGAFLFDREQRKEDVRDMKAVLELGSIAVAERDGKNTAFPAEELVAQSDNRLLKSAWAIVSQYADEESADDRLLQLIDSIKRWNNGN